MKIDAVNFGPAGYGQVVPAPRRVPYTSSGPTSVIQASKLIDPDPMVPFPWDLPPRNSTIVYQPNSIVAPAAATQTQILQYQVPSGHYFALKARMNAFDGQSWVRGSGDIIWTTDVDTPIGITSPQGEPIQGLQAEAFNVGSFDHGPVPWWGRKVFTPLEIIRVKVLTTNAINPGAPNYFTSILIGWIWPDDRL